MSFDPTLIGYSAAAIAYLLLAIGLMTVWRGRYEGGNLIVSALATSAWGFALAFSTSAEYFSSTLVFVSEIASDTAWLIFLSSLLSGGIMTERAWVTRYAGVAMALVIMILGLLVEFSPAVQVAGIRPGAVLIYGSILTSLYALVSLEQIYRNARRNQVGELKHLCLGLAGIFAVDLLLYSNAIFIAETGVVLWESRGFVVAMCAPLIALSVARRSGSGKSLFFSRQVVFYSATLIGAGLYLLLIAIAGYLVQSLGQKWQSVAQVALISGGLLLFVVLAISERLRGLIRVYIVKHFFASKYDYREEWLKLIQTLTSTNATLPLRKRSIQVLAQIVGAHAGTLWLEGGDSRAYVPVAAWNMSQPDAYFDASGSLIRFLLESGWVLDLDELRQSPGRFGQSDSGSLPAGLEAIRVIVPLTHENRLIGIVGLTAPKKVAELNFEDFDFLKLAGQQIAGHLVQDAATERLAESRQFEAFNRLTAFVMHDLKNAIAQQTLLIKNAEKHKRNPDFVDDAMETIKGSVAHIRKVVDMLQQGFWEEHLDRVDIGKLILQASSVAEDRQPVPTVKLCDDRLFVRADRERLLMALCHAIRNAQDATSRDGKIGIELGVEGDSCVIRISDSGKGMSEEFIRDRLFKPFDSTKGTQGMGIGAYQIRETIRSAGGAIRVESTPNTGTDFYLTLPLTA